MVRLLILRLSTSSSLFCPSRGSFVPRSQLYIKALLQFHWPKVASINYFLITAPHAEKTFKN